MALDDFLMNALGNGVASAPQSPSSVANPGGGPVPPATTPAPQQAVQAPTQGAPTMPTPGTQAAPAAPSGGFVKALKGPLGTHGALGSVLGTLEDIILVNSGLQAQYQPKLQAAKEADAIQGWDKDPAGAYLKLASVAGVKAADTHLDSLVTGSYKNALTGQATQSTDNAAQLAPITRNVELIKAKAPYYNIAAHITPTSAPGVIANIKSAYARNGWPTDDLPKTDDPGEWKQWSVQGVPSGTLYSTDNTKDYRNATLAQADRRLDQQGDNIQSEIDYRKTMGGVAQTNAGTGQGNLAVNQGRLGESERHNTVMEGQGAQRLSAPTPTKVLGGIYDTLAKGGKLTQGQQAALAAAKQRGAAPTTGQRRVINGHIFEWNEKLGHGVDLGPAK